MEKNKVDIVRELSKDLNLVVKNFIKNYGIEDPELSPGQMIDVICSAFFSSIDYHLLMFSECVSYLKIPTIEMRNKLIGFYNEQFEIKTHKID